MDSNREDSKLKSSVSILYTAINYFWLAMKDAESAYQKIPAPVHWNTYYFSGLVPEKQITFFISVKE